MQASRNSQTSASDHYPCPLARRCDALPAERKPRAGLGTSHNGLQRPVAPEDLKRANERNTLLCQTESTVALENFEEIARVPSVARVAPVAKAHGQLAGTQPGSLRQAEEWMELGYNVISYSTDIGVYGSALAEEIRQARDIASRSAGT